MNYQAHYDRLIEKHGTWKKPKNGYTERHRKLPGYLGGKYVMGNAFYMSARAHYVAHILWAKMTDHSEAWSAVKQMGANAGRQASRMYETARKRHASDLSIMFSGEGHPMYGKSPSAETRKKQSAASLGKHKSEEMKARLSASNMGHHVSDETKRKLRASQTGRKASQAARSKMSNNLTGNTRMLGHKHTDETKRLISESSAGKVWTNESKHKMSIFAKLKTNTCPVCGMSANPGNMARHLKKHSKLGE